MSVHAMSHSDAPFPAGCRRWCGGGHDRRVAEGRRAPAQQATTTTVATDATTISTATAAAVALRGAVLAERQQLLGLGATHHHAVAA